MAKYKKYFILFIDTFTTTITVFNLCIHLHVVPGVTATMSSQYTSPTGIYTPDKGIDGIYVPNHYPDSLITTQSEQSPWYQMDLGTNRCVRGVTIWNRGTWARMSIFSLIRRHNRDKFYGIHVLPK